MNSSVFNSVFFNYFLFIPLLVLGTACHKDDSIQGSNTSSILYFNSFENSNDLRGVDGNAFYLSGDNTGRSGDSSLMVSGGCIGPHFNLDIGPFGGDKKVTLSLFGKVDYESCGSVSLRSMKTFEMISIVLIDSVWTRYESPDTLLLPENEILRIEITSGGFAACSSFIDLLTIEEH